MSKLVELKSEGVKTRIVSQRAAHGFVLELRATPNNSDPIRNLRGLLKAAARRFHFRCTNLRETDGGKQ
jgi:hypothetical protein